MAKPSEYSIKEIYLKDSINQHYEDCSQINYFGEDDPENNSEDAELRERSKEMISRMMLEDPYLFC